MTSLADSLDLGGLRLSSGEGRQLELLVRAHPLALGGSLYTLSPERVPVHLRISRMAGHGYALQLRFEVDLRGACMRCLEPAALTTAVDIREVSQPGSGEGLESPYVDRGVLDLDTWVRDALALALPRTVLCRDDCAGLCAVCGANLNIEGPGHHHDAAPDPRWAKLSELRLNR